MSLNRNKRKIMKNLKKTFAGLLALGLVVGGANQAFTSENTEKETTSIFEILTTSDKKSDNKNQKDDDKKDIDSYEKDPEYIEEFKSRYDLYEKIILAKEMGDIEIDGFIDVLNKKAATKEDLENALEELNKLIDKSDNKIALDLDVDALKENVKDYILYGKLFFADKLDKSDIKNLYLFYEATVNSYTYTKGADEVKKSFNPTLEEIYNYILEIDKKVEEKIEITDDDKKKTSEYFDKLLSLIDDSKENILKLETTSLNKDGYFSDASEEDDNINVNSAFYKSDRVGVKQGYIELDAQKREYLDRINTNNDDYITEEEIKADGQYSLPLEGNSDFIRPFFGNPDEEEKSAEVTSTEVENQEENQETNQEENQNQTPATTPQNPQGEKPETVTLSQGENTVGTEEKKEEEKEEEKPTLLTKAASQVKTGIKGVGYLGIILIIALAVYFVMVKKKKEDNKEDK